MSTPQRCLVGPALALTLLAPALAACSTTPAGDLDTGDCLDSASLQDAEGMVGRVSLIECADEHDTEVISAFDVDEGDYPGAEQLGAIAGDRCTADFREYVGVDYVLSDLQLIPLFPSQEGWEAGDHRIICIATAPEPITASIEDSGR